MEQTHHRPYYKPMTKNEEIDFIHFLLNYGVNPDKLPWLLMIVDYLAWKSNVSAFFIVHCIKEQWSGNV
jgi:hypothetical protein